MNPKMSSFLTKGFFKKVSAFAAAGALSSSLIACSSGGEKASTDSADASMCSNIHVGTQDQVINTAVGGAVVRELKIFEENLPKDGKYKDLAYNVEWSSYTSGPPITNKMMAGQIQKRNAWVPMHSVQQKSRLNHSKSWFQVHRLD